jgi:hypothetical protein
MNSSKFFGSADSARAVRPAATSGAVLSAIPSAQQSVMDSALQELAELPWILAAAGLAEVSCNLPKRASMAPTMHSFNTSGGKPCSAPWNG